MRFEYTAIHNRFKALVDDLLTGYLEELGVSPETFLEVATKMGTDKLNEFVVSSILTVDNFVQFRNMMVQRNIDLTHQALSQLEEERDADAPEQPGTPEREAAPKQPEPEPEPEPKPKPVPESEPVPEKTAAKESPPPTPGKDGDLAAALEASRKLEEERQTEQQREEEREAQELARALALSREEEETRKEVLEAEAAALRGSKEEATEAAATAAAEASSSSAGAGSSCSGAGSGSGSGNSVPAATEPAAPEAPTEPIRPRMTELPPIRGPRGLHSGAGFSSSSSEPSKSGGGLFKRGARPLDPPPLVSDLSSLREAAKAAAMAQKKFLSSDFEDTRKRMLAENKSKRDNHLQSYLQRGSAMKGMVFETAAYKSVTGAGAGSHAHAAEQDSKRAALRTELARKLKQDLLGGRAATEG